MGDGFEFLSLGPAFFHLPVRPLIMKLKQAAEDFHVEELTDVVPGADGLFALYRLEKTNWTTPDALAVVRKRWRIEPRRVSCGGLKDRHARTVQHVSIFQGPRRNMKQQGLSLTYLGQLAKEYSAQEIRANRFVVVLRDLEHEQAERMLRTIEVVREEGVPNYFGAQRLGYVASGGEFMAKLMVLGRFGEALRMALTAPYEFDRGAQKREKATLLAHWGDWQTCRAKLRDRDSSGPIDHLLHNPSDFRGALE